jgi:hypothetical protein
VLVVGRVDVGRGTVVFYILPVVDIGLLVELTLSLDTLDTGTALDNLPALHVIVHERLADTRVEVTSRKLDVVCRLELALAKTVGEIEKLRIRHFSRG